VHHLDDDTCTPPEQNYQYLFEDGMFVLLETFITQNVCLAANKVTMYSKVRR
jgi:hypothetical protein